MPTSDMIRSVVKTISKLPKRGRGTQREIISSIFTSIDSNETRGISFILPSRCLDGTTTTNGNGLSKRRYTSTPDLKMVSITYIEPDGGTKTVDAEVGTDLLSAAHDNEIELEGACGGELACSTCHLIFDPDIYDTLPEKDEEEEDMLDLAFEVTDTSRLGCQVTVQENFDGMTVQIPDDGF